MGHQSAAHSMDQHLAVHHQGVPGLTRCGSYSSGVVGIGLPDVCCATLNKLMAVYGTSASLAVVACAETLVSNIHGRRNDPGANGVFLPLFSANGCFTVGYFAEP